jgi:NAD(P)H-dependent FMN reductase
MPSSSKLCIIYGSAREGRFCDVVAGWVRTEFERRGLAAISIVDPLDGLNTADRNAKLAAADAFVVVIPRPQNRDSRSEAGCDRAGVVIL